MPLKSLEKIGAKPLAHAIGDSLLHCNPSRSKIWLIPAWKEPGYRVCVESANGPIADHVAEIRITIEEPAGPDWGGFGHVYIATTPINQEEL